MEAIIQGVDLQNGDVNDSQTHRREGMWNVHIYILYVKLLWESSYLD